MTSLMFLLVTSQGEEVETGLLPSGVEILDLSFFLFYLFNIFYFFNFTDYVVVVFLSICIPKQSTMFFTSTQHLFIHFTPFSLVLCPL